MGRKGRGGGPERGRIDKRRREVGQGLGRAYFCRLKGKIDNFQFCFRLRLPNRLRMDGYISVWVVGRWGWCRDLSGVCETWNREGTTITCKQKLMDPSGWISCPGRGEQNRLGQIG